MTSTDDIDDEQNDDQSERRTSPLSDLLRSVGDGDRGGDDDQEAADDDAEDHPFFHRDPQSGLAVEEMAGVGDEHAGRLPPRTESAPRTVFDPHTITEHQLIDASPIVARAVSAALLAYEMDLDDAPPFGVVYPDGYDPGDLGPTDPVEGSLGGPREDGRWVYYPVTNPDVLGGYSVAWAREAIDRWTAQSVDPDALWHPEVALSEDDGLPGDETATMDGPPGETHRERLDRFERKVGATPSKRSLVTSVEEHEHSGEYDPAMSVEEGTFRGDPECRHCIIFSPGTSRAGKGDLPKFPDGRTPADVAAERYDLDGDDQDGDGNGGIATAFSGP